MRVCIGCHGQFHAFDLARQMERLGNLEALYTGYPRSRVKGLPPEKVNTFPWLIAPLKALTKVGLPQSRLPRFASRLAMSTFDQWMARKVAPCDVFDCTSGTGVAARRAAKQRYGALTVCDRGSSHIEYQDDLLAEEHARWGLPYRRVDTRTELAGYREADVITVPSTFAYWSFVSKGVPESKLARIPTGVDLSTFRPVPKEDEVFRVVYVGALTIRKGIPYLLEAIAGLDLPNLELWLIGRQSPQMQKLFAKYEGKFRFLGPMPRNRLYWYYSQASVFVMPSIEEGLAQVLAQAMACRLPVVATTNTGAEDLITDGAEGYVVPIRDPEAIRDRVARLHDHPAEREAMGAAALARTGSFGGWDSYGESVAAMYAAKLAAAGDSRDTGAPVR